MNWVKRLFEEYKFMRRFAMFWAMGTVSYCIGLVTYVTIQMINGGKFTEGMFIAVVGLVGTTIVLIGTMNALYQWDKMLDKK